MKSGLSSGNPHRFDVGDRERRGIRVWRLVETSKWEHRSRTGELFRYSPTGEHGNYTYRFL